MLLLTAPTKLNMLAEGKTVTLTLRKPAQVRHRRAKQRCVVMLHRLSKTELLVAYIDKGCTVVDITGNINALDMISTGLPMYAMTALAYAINQHRKLENDTKS